MDTRKFIIEEFGLPEDVGFDKVQRLTYGEIEELLTKFDKVRREECTIPVVSGSLPLATDEEIQKYVTERFSESHLLPEIIAFRAIKYYQQGMPPASGRRCCLDESEGKQ